MGAGSERRAGQHPEPLLPAPYRSPWRQLGESLRAVLADLGLGLRRLQRLNRQGELPAPALWPRSLAPVFWPVLLSLGLGLLVFGGLWLRTQSPLEVEMAAPPPLSATPLAPAADSSADPLAEQGAKRPPGASPSSPAPSKAPLEDSVSLPGAGSAAAPARHPAAEVAAPGSDSLPGLLSEPEAAGQLAAAAADPASARLRFTLGAGFESLALPERQVQADCWLLWARELGYEHLELRDGRGRLVAREALLGDGMILLSTRPSS